MGFSFVSIINICFEHYLFLILAQSVYVSLKGLQGHIWLSSLSWCSALIKPQTKLNIIAGTDLSLQRQKYVAFTISKSKLLKVLNIKLIIRIDFRFYFHIMHKNFSFFISFMAWWKKKRKKKKSKKSNLKSTTVNSLYLDLAYLE